MFRFYEEFVLKAFILLMWARRSGLVINDEVKQRIQEEMVNGNWDSNSGARTIVDNIPLRPLFDDFNFDQIVKEMGDSVTTHFRSRGGSQDADLIDTVVKILKLSRGTSRINGKTLETLRKAILNSDELAGLKDRIAKGELTCGTCGKELVAGEMLTLYRGSDGVNNVVCLGCATPTYAQCDHSSKCNNKIPIPDSMRGGIRKMCDKGCVSCQNPEKKIEEGWVAGSDIRLDDGSTNGAGISINSATGVITATPTITGDSDVSPSWVLDALSEDPDDDEDDRVWDELDQDPVSNEDGDTNPTPFRTDALSGRIVGMSTPPTEPSWRSWISREQIEEMRRNILNDPAIRLTPTGGGGATVTAAPTPTVTTTPPDRTFRYIYAPESVPQPPPEPVWIGEDSSGAEIWRTSAPVVITGIREDE